MLLGLNTIAPSIAGLEAVIVTVIPDNLLYDAWSKDQRVADAEESATYFGDLVRVHFDALASVGVPRGDIQITIETDGLIVLLRNIRANYVISLVFQDTTPLGLMRLHTKRLIQFIDDNLPFFEDEDDPAVPFAPQPAPKPYAPPAPEPEYYDYNDAQRARYARPSEDEDHSTSETPQAASETAQPEHIDATTHAEEPKYHGYVYARDKERLNAQKGQNDANEQDGADVQQSPAPDAFLEADPFLLDTPADPSFFATPNHPPAELTTPTQVADMMNEGGPTQHKELDQKPEPILRTKEQVAEMVSEGGPPTPLEDLPSPKGPTHNKESEPHSEPILRTKEQVAEMVNEGGPPTPLEDCPQPTPIASHNPAPERITTPTQVAEMINEGGPALRNEKDHRPEPILRTKEQVATMDYEGGPPTPYDNRPEALRSTAPIRVLDQAHASHPPRQTSAPRKSDAELYRRAIDRLESEGGVVPAKPVDSPNHPTADLRLSDQELRMTEEGGRPLPPSPTAKHEDLERKLQDAHDGTIAAQHRVSGRTNNARQAHEHTDPSKAQDTLETAPSRAKKIIDFVTANTSTPQNVQARLAVHSRVPLDSIKEPQTLNNDEVQRLEDAAKAILGVSKLDI